MEDIMNLNNENLTRAEKLKLWKSMKSSSSSSSSALSATSSSNSISTISSTPSTPLRTITPSFGMPTSTSSHTQFRKKSSTVNMTKPSQKKYQLNGSHSHSQSQSQGNHSKSILFKKKNYKKSFKLKDDTSSVNDEKENEKKEKYERNDENERENSCPNEKIMDDSLYSSTSSPTSPLSPIGPTITPKKITKISFFSQSSPHLDDGYMTANDCYPYSLDNIQLSSTNDSILQRQQQQHHLNSLPYYDTATTPLRTSSERTSIEKIKKEYQLLQEENKKLKYELQLTKQLKDEAIEITKMCQNEIETLMFTNDILLQKSLQDEEYLIKERMRSHDKDNHKIDKYKEEIKNLKAKNLEYERRANEMVAEMNHQMTQLQDMAMSRIESLEKELLLEQHKSETLQNSIQKLSIQNTRKQNYTRRRTNTIKSSSTGPTPSSSIISPLPTCRNRRGSRKLSTETETDDGSGDEDDSLTIGSNSEDEIDHHGVGTSGTTLNFLHHDEEDEQEGVEKSKDQKKNMKTEV